MSSPAPSLVSPSRLSQIEATVQAFVSTFEQPLDTPEALQRFLSIYSPEIEWYDHAFHMHRIGHDAVVGLHRSFNYANQPFHTEIKKIHTTPSHAVLELIWHGVSANDIVRPSGEVVVKANRREFAAHVCLVLAIDDEGKIRRIDEYYNRKWEEGVGEGVYAVLRGEGMTEGRGRSAAAL